MKNLKVISIGGDCENFGIDLLMTFQNGISLCSYHDNECCEHHYLSVEDLVIEDFEELEFDLSDDNFFERIEGYGIALKPINGFPIRIAGYADNNGWYSSNLSLSLWNGKEIIRSYDITECQDY